MIIFLRAVLKGCGIRGLSACLGCLPLIISAQPNAVKPLEAGPEVEAFKKAQQQLLLKYEVPATSKYVQLTKPAMKVHVLEAGKGSPLVIIHGGGSTAATFAPLMSSLQKKYHIYAPDRPGCGLSDKIDYKGIDFRKHAVDFIKSLYDSLQLSKASIIANSMGGYWALVFALAHPEKVDKLILVGEPARSSPPGQTSLAAPIAATPSLASAKGKYAAILVANIDKVPIEILEEDLAGALLPNAVLSWNSMLAQIKSEGKNLTYSLRPELKNLKPKTLFIWGDKDKFAPPSYGQEMAAIAPRARCEVVTDAGHLVWMDQPERCAQLIVDFLKR